MDKQQAQDIVKETFESSFDKGMFTGFIKNLLNSIEDAPFSYKGNLIPDAYEQYISTLERIGKYSAGDHKIDILVVKLKKKTSIERARTMQRNFIAWYLNGSRGGEMKDAALAAFVSPNGEDWRFSLVKMDYRFEEGKNSKVKVKEEFTPARRWSFLVGKNENSHTAQSKLYPIIADDEHKPTLAELEETFNIEKVTKEFFEKYRDLFLRTKETLDEVVSGDKKIKADFEAKGVNTVDFAKKLLGQIVFLYFLQKKGWFGVKRDTEWGTGTKHFLRELFEGRHGTYTNFFNDILEPLFYEALRIDRSHDDGYYSRFNCKIPFLNGGLFDPINNYDWVHTDIILPNELFSNSFKTKEGDKGNGILDIFDRYNFTVKEDEPLEKEVAVDPEMLGKVFENLLEVKDRKSKGTYYTPREIVHYMCRQSLISYLATELSDCHSPSSSCHSCKDGNPVPSREDIETLIKYGEQVGENEATVVAKGRETDTYYHKLPERIRQNAVLIDEKLANIKVCDPAIGSGAFPVGMMSEIVKTRQILSAYLSPSPSSPPIKGGEIDGSPLPRRERARERGAERTPYNFKRECIEKSLYGVDIDPGAVEIAKLRLWLSLMVDEEDIKQIKPLPNLDYKIVCGNSLLGVNLMFHHQALLKFEDLKGKFFEETNPKKKTEFKNEIDNLIREITNDDKHFDFKIYFSEIFNPSVSPLIKGGGFDIVIANPPYVRHEAIKDMKPELKKQFGEFFCGTADIYTYFYHRGLDVLKSDGHLCFIAPNKFMRAGYGKNTRALLATKATPKIVIDFCDLPIFDATTYPSVLLVEKRKPSEQDKTFAVTFTTEEQLAHIDETIGIIGFEMPILALRPEGWNLEQPEVIALMEKLRKAGMPLGEYVHGKFYYGIKTGLNEAFVIDLDTRKRLIKEDPKSNELIKPWLRGRDIKKWTAEWAGLYLINIQSSSNHHWPWSDEKAESKAKKIFKETYPSIHDHLTQWKDKLQQRDDQGKFWWELRSCAYYQEFEQPKITWGNLATEPKFAIDEEACYVSAPAVIIPTNDVYLLAVLNSPLCKWWISMQAAVRSGGFLEYKPMYVGTVPVVKTTDKQKVSIVTLVNQILTAKKQPPSSPFSKGELSNADTSLPVRCTQTGALEKQIDEMVYALYGLTPEEIAIIEGRK
ncbi:MAG: Eco57I restriction-modification methylase domain-containing protein [Nitrospirae bacterium]|nr:Eco57I restriction-modification methylase domain-containing protein [Nitrospirota bacterium]